MDSVNKNVINDTLENSIQAEFFTDEDKVMLTNQFKERYEFYREQSK